MVHRTVQVSSDPTDTWRNDNNVFITSKRRRRRRLDAMKTLLLRRLPAGDDRFDGFIYNGKTEAVDPFAGILEKLAAL